MSWRIFDELTERVENDDSIDVIVCNGSFCFRYLRQYLDLPRRFYYKNKEYQIIIDNDISNYYVTNKKEYKRIKMIQSL